MVDIDVVIFDRETEKHKTIQDGLDNNNCKPFWRYIKAKRQDNIGVAPLKRKGNL